MTRMFFVIAGLPFLVIAGLTRNLTAKIPDRARDDVVKMPDRGPA